MKKKIAVLILSLVLLITTGPAAIAAGSPTITINTADTGRSYGAYQVFAGNVSGTALTDITWGTGVDAASLTAALAARYDSISTDMSAAQIAGAIQAMKLEENTGGADELAQIIGQHLAGSCAGSAESEKGYTIALADGPGYYLVRDERVPETGACTQNILTYSGTTVTPKESSPTVEKKVSNGTDYDTTAVWAEGDIFDFQITGTLPTDYEAYSTYYYRFTDTFQTVGGKSVFDYCGSPEILVVNGSRKTDITGAFTITENADGTGLSAVCTDLKAISGAEITADSRIVFTYNARLNANAVIGGTGNYNKVDLTYSNNPFTLTAVSTGAPLPTNGTELSITGSGSADYTFDLSSARPGDIYEYTLRQQSAGANNYTQDTSEYTVRIYIVRNDSGVLSPVTVITGADTKYESCAFTNQYAAPAAADQSTSSPFTGVTENTGALLLAAALIAAGAIIVIAGKTKAAGKDVR